MHLIKYSILLIFCVYSQRCSSFLADKLCFTESRTKEKSLLCRSVNNSEAFTQVVIADTKSVVLDCPAELFNISGTEYEELLGNLRDFRPPVTDVSSLSLKNCLHFEKNITGILRSWGVNLSSVASLSYENNYGDFSLSDNIFEGFGNLDYVSVHWGLDHISDGHLKNLGNLEELMLHGNSLKNVNGAFTNLKQLKFLQLGSNTIESLDDSSFDSLISLDRLNLEANQIRSVTENTFRGLRNLKILGLSINYLTNLPPKLFDSNANLEELGLARNSFTTFPSTLLRNLVMLKKLDLQGNSQLEELPEDLFMNTTKLQTLNLSSCKISKLPPGLFRNLGELKTLDLSHNLIDVLVEENFKTLSRLENLNLGYNQLGEIDARAFVWLEHLKTLHIPNNKLRSISTKAFDEDCSIEILDVSSNFLAFDTNEEQSPFRFCMRLRQINLSFNNISAIFEDWLNLTGNLTHLNLTYNNFTTLDYNSLTFMTGRDLEVDLRYNNIEVINMRLAGFQDTYLSDNRKILLVDHNPIICDCSAYPLSRYLNRALPGAAFSWDIKGATCSLPHQLANQTVDSVDPLEFVCQTMGPVQDCPANCSCILRPADVTVVATCFEKPRNFQDFTTGSKVQLNLSGSTVGLASLLESSKPQNNVVSIDLSNTTIDEDALNIDWTAFGEVFPRVEELRLNSNRLRFVPESAIKAWSQNKLRLALGDNPYDCSCEVEGLLEFVQHFHQRIVDVNSVVCGDRPFISLTIQELCPVLQSGAMAVIVGILFVLILLLIAGWISWRFRRTIRAWMYASGCCLRWVIQKDDADDEDKPYDAFVSFSHKDEDFVLNTLVPGLEEPSDGSQAFRLCLHYRDWLAGEWIPEQIARSVASSKRTIVVLSQHFLDSVWGQLEFRTAYNQVLKDKRSRLIVVVNGDLPSKDLMDQDLKTYLSLNTYLQWGDPWFWERLRYALPHTKGKSSNLTKIYREGNLNDHKEASVLNKGLAPLPLSRSSVKVDITIPPEIELNLTPTSSVSSADPIFPQDSK